MKPIFKRLASMSSFSICQSLLSGLLEELEAEAGEASGPSSSATAALTRLENLLGEEGDLSKPEKDVIRDSLRNNLINVSQFLSL